MLKTLAYYAGYILMPVLSLIYLVDNLYSAIKNAFRNTVSQTRSDIRSHKRACGRGSL